MNKKVNIEKDEYAESVFAVEKTKSSFFKTFFTCFVYQKITLALARFFYKIKFNPNIITCFMLITVLIASVLFLVPNVVCLIIGAIVLQFFEIFDDVDGIVARATNKLSKKGEQLDFLMHIICHPILICVFGYLLFNLFPATTIFGVDKLIFFIVMFGIMMTCELIMRQIIALNVITKLKVNHAEMQVAEHKTPLIIKLFRWIKSFFDMFPVYALVVPIFIIIDTFCGTQIAFWYSVIYILVSMATILKACVFKLVDYARCKQ